MSGDPAFEIPTRPQRRFPSTGGVEYEGSTRFLLTPAADPDEGLESLVAAVLADGPYRTRDGSIEGLPMALWLVRDDETADVFRVSVRDGAVRLHVLPATERAGLRAFYERLRDRGSVEWTVDCRIDAE